MSKVSAIVLVVREPCVMTVASGAADGLALGSAGGSAVAGGTMGEGLGAELGPGLGVGGLFSSTTLSGRTMSTQPTSRRFGSYASDSGSSDGYAPRFHQAIERAVVRNCFAIELSVSPDRTV
jgi:hypothetical protein